MEELKPDSIKNKNQEQKEKISKNILDKNQNKVTEEKNLEKQDSESDPNIIDQKKELEKISLSHIKQYSFLDLIKKSFSFSKSNFKLPLFKIIRKFLSHIIDAKIPLTYGKLLNSIIKEKNYQKLLSEFKNHIFFSFMRVIIII